jgi:hypothetical protein
LVVRCRSAEPGPADHRTPHGPGTPTEAGTSNVVVRQLEGTEVIAETSFEWTIRPTVDIEFAL